MGEYGTVHALWLTYPSCFHRFFCIYIMVMVVVSRLSPFVDLCCFIGILYMVCFWLYSSFSSTILHPLLVHVVYINLQCYASHSLLLLNLPHHSGCITIGYALKLVHLKHGRNVWGPYHARSTYLFKDLIMTLLGDNHSHLSEYGFGYPWFSLVRSMLILC